MIIQTIKEVLRNWLDENENDDEQNNPHISKILSIHKRIKSNKNINADMITLSDRLVYNYLPAIEASFIACEGSNESLRVSRISRDISQVKDAILTNIENCLVDIEHGAVFTDNFSSPFVKSLLDFEACIDARDVV